MSGFAVAADAPVISDGPLPDGVIAAFWRYERALMSDDITELDRLFAPGPDTMRGDAGGLLVGHDTIAAFRRGRGGAPKRRIAEVHAQLVGEDAVLLIAVLESVAGGRGQQTQLWRRQGDGWRVSAAHVSGPTPAVDARIWRTVGTPLVGASNRGALDGETVAVKDLFAVAGHRIGAGVPAYLAEAGASRVTAPAVAGLLGSGASVTGIARTDEFAYSIAGANPHYGTPPNAAVPGALPGGSSNGPASAVALGQASIGLATDTAGSIRVPASYQGLWGLRTTHGAISVDGVLPLAPSFDTVGWLTRSGDLLALVSATQLGAGGGIPSRVAIAPALLRSVEAGVAEAFAAGMRLLIESGRIEEPAEVELPDAEAVYADFRIVQAAEAWRAHGSWLEAHPGAVGGAVADRFAAAAAITPSEEQDARHRLGEARFEIDAAIDGVLLALPSAASAAPQSTAPATEVDRVRAATLQLTCFAGIIGAPSLSVPLLRTPAGPLGLSLIGPRGGDTPLVQFAAGLAG
jgi:amidase